MGTGDVAPPRTRGARIHDTSERLARDVDCWVATASPSGGEPWLVPLSCWWDGASLLLATTRESTTVRNLAAGSGIRLSLGHTRDVVLIDGTAVCIAEADLADEQAAAFAAHAGFDPRAEPEPYTWIRVTPVRIQAWREANELPGRTLMREGAWLTD